jgi:uncharacterized damage-inducible protein DinB
MFSRRLRAVLLVLFCPLMYSEQNARSIEEQPSVAAVLESHRRWMEENFVPAAEAMPEDKFFWTPVNGEFKGARNYGEQIEHVAEVNFHLAAAVLGETVPAEADGPEKNPANYKTKAAVLQYLKNSFAYTQKAMASVTEQNARLPVKHPLLGFTTTRLGLSIVMVAHPFNHYGQMVEYLRMNGIVPPSSRN